MNPSEFRAICLSRYGYGWQTRLAKDMGVNARTVRRWASGEADVPPSVAAAIQARPRIALDYPDKWLIAYSEDQEREYLIHLAPPRFIGLIEGDVALASGTTLALRDETIVDITWIDPEPTDVAAIIPDLQDFLDRDSRD